jgi:hypothetical protein
VTGLPEPAQGRRRRPYARELAREWPTLGDLEEARLRYPEPMFAPKTAYQEVAGYDPDKEDELL